MDDRSEEIRRALEWMTAAFRQHQMPFQVVGGLAAWAHGGTRPVVDLDFYAPLADADAFLADAATHIVWGPEHYRDRTWDLRFMKIDHGRMRIEIGDTSSDPAFFDTRNRQWVQQRIDFTASVPMTVFGLTLPVMPLPDLLAYKAALDRPVDRIDIAQLTGGG